MRKIDGYNSQGCPIYSAECYKCEEVMPDPNDCPCGCCGDSSSTSAQGTGLPFSIALTPIASSCAAAVKPSCPKDCYPYLVTLPNGCQVWKCSCKCIPPPPPPPSYSTNSSIREILNIISKRRKI
jgi:hypothetical protein